jgi:hypothetical protein
MNRFFAAAAIALALGAPTVAHAVSPALEAHVKHCMSIKSIIPTFDDARQKIALAQTAARQAHDSDGWARMNKAASEVYHRQNEILDVLDRALWDIDADCDAVHKWAIDYIRDAIPHYEPAHQ